MLFFSLEKMQVHSAWAQSGQNTEANLNTVEVNGRIIVDVKTETNQNSAIPMGK